MVCAFLYEAAVAGVEKVILTSVEYVHVIVCSGYPMKLSEPDEALPLVGDPPRSALTSEAGILAHIALVSAALAEEIGIATRDSEPRRQLRPIMNGVLFFCMVNTFC